MAGLKPEYIEATAKELSTLQDLWSRVDEALSSAMGVDPISREEENSFLKVKSEGTKYHRILKNKLTDQTTKIKRLDFNYDRMIEILRSAISLGHLRNLPEADQKKMKDDMHRIGVQLDHVIGAYDFLRSGEIDLSRATRKKGSGLGAKLKRVTKAPQFKLLLTLAIVGGAVFAALVMLGVVEI